jgi:hypothetical protein
VAKVQQDDQHHHNAQAPDYATCCAHDPLLPDWLNVPQACRRNSHSLSGDVTGLREADDASQETMSAGEMMALASAPFRTMLAAGTVPARRCSANMAVNLPVSP